jgi:hypothetical protein
MFSVLSIVVGAAMIGLWHPGQAAAAVSCAPQVNPSNLHCYGVALWQNIARSYEGESAKITPVCLHSSTSAPGNFVSEEMWEGTDNSGTGAYWIEEGAITHPRPQWFWANFYPGARKVFVFYQRQPSVTLGKTYLAQMMYIGSNEWQILATPAGETTWELDATAHYQPPYTKGLVAGTEYTAGGDRTRGTAKALQYQRTDGSWGDWFGARPKTLGPHHYATAKMPNGHEVDWSTRC